MARDTPERVFITVDGRRLELPPFTEADVPDLEDLYAESGAAKDDAFRAVSAKVEAAGSPAEREAIIAELDAALCRGPRLESATGEDLSRWADETKDGVAASLYLMLRKQHADVTLDAARRAVQRLGLAETLRLRDAASAAALKSITPTATAGARS